VWGEEEEKEINVWEKGDSSSSSSVLFPPAVNNVDWSDATHT
jgi:hypothetical protein